MISEGEVSEALGVSRTPVREAFLRLESEGVLELFPKRGALVVPITSVDMRNVLEARLVIEPWAVAIVSRLTDRQPLVRILEGLMAELRNAQLPAHVLRYQEADRSFHEAIVDASENEIIATFYRSLRDRQLRMGAVALVTIGGRSEMILSEHQQIAQAIADGDSERAASLVQAHIAHTRDALELELRTV
jgi:DNA-binding GntR family transcriptional regulator